MSLPIVFAVLLAACFHAAWNASVKLGEDKLLSVAGIMGATALIALPMVPFVGLPHPDSWPWLVASAVLHVSYYISLANAYRYGDFSQAYPIARGTAPILVTLWGVAMMNEPLKPLELVSVTGVIVGIMIFATRGLGAVVHDTRSLVFALVTSLFIGAYTIVDGIGGRLSMSVPAYMIWLSVLDGVPIALYAAWRRPWSGVVSLWRNRSLVLLGAVLSLAAYWIVVWAMTQAPIPLVSAIRETSIIIAALIGAYYFKEPAGKRRVVASGIIFLSIALLAFA